MSRDEKTAEEKFNAVRIKAAESQLVVVRPDGQYLLLPALGKESVRPELITAVERLMPSNIKRNVAVIADTSWTLKQPLTIQAANSAIPFFGLLMGLTSIGHSVWIYDGAGDLLEAGCCQADVLIVDSACVGILSPDWHDHVVKGYA